MRKLDEIIRDPSRNQRTANVNSGVENGMGGEKKGSHGRWRKIDIPLFAVKNAYANKVEKYFHLKAVPEREIISAAMVAMEGRALLVPMVGIMHTKPHLGNVQKCHH